MLVLKKVKGCAILLPFLQGELSKGLRGNLKEYKKNAIKKPENK